MGSVLAYVKAHPVLLHTDHPQIAPGASVGATTTMTAAWAPPPRALARLVVGVLWSGLAVADARSCARG